MLNDTKHNNYVYLSFNYIVIHKCMATKHTSIHLPISDNTENLIN